MSPSKIRQNYTDEVLVRQQVSSEKLWRNVSPSKIICQNFWRISQKIISTKLFLTDILSVKNITFRQKHNFFPSKNPSKNLQSFIGTSHCFYRHSTTTFAVFFWEHNFIKPMVISYLWLGVQIFHLYPGMFVVTTDNFFLIY